MIVSPTINNVHGRIFSFTTADPAAGAEISHVVPARRRWIIHALHFTLVTDVTVIDRFIRLRLSDEGGILFHRVAATAQGASKTVFYSFANVAHDEVIAADKRTYSLPPIPLMAGYTIVTSTTNLQAGDDYSIARLIIEEWIDP
jgi:hypothetical protein